jgi:integrase
MSALIPYQRKQSHAKALGAIRHAHPIDPPSAATLRELGLVAQLPPNEFDELKALHGHALADNSHRSYASDARQWGKFMAARYPDVEPRNAAILHCVMWLKEMAKTLSLATLNRRLAWLKAHSGVSALRDPTLAPELTRTYDDIIQGLRRGKHQERIRGKKPILLPMLRKMWERLSGGTLDEQQARLWLTLTWWSAMRRSEIRSLQWKSVEITDRGCLINIVVSKTGFNQQVAINFKPDDEMCPVAALQRWKSVSAATPELPVFRTIKAGELTTRPVAVKTMVRYIKEGVEQACNEAPRDHCCHGLRAGFATQHAHLPLSVVMSQTRHRSVQAASVYMKTEKLFDAGF